MDVTETRFGFALSDPYRWMEGADNAETQHWLVEQGQSTRNYLASIPGRDALSARVHELGTSIDFIDQPKRAGTRWFYFHEAPGAQLATLCVLEANGEHVLVDPATLQDRTGHVSIDSMSPSPDGRLVAYVVSRGGGEQGEVRVRDVASGTDLPDRAERLFSLAGVQWLPDGKSFLYLQKQAITPGVDPMLNAQLRLHRLGTPSSADIGVLGNGAGRGVKLTADELPDAKVSRNGRWVIGLVAAARNESRVVVASLDEILRAGSATRWRDIAGYADGVQNAWLRGDRIYMTSYRDAPNMQIVSQPAAGGAEPPRVEVPEDPSSPISDFAVARDGLYVVRMKDGLARLWRRAWNGPLTEVPLPFEGWISTITGDSSTDGVVITEEGWTRLTAHYVYVPGAHSVMTPLLPLTTKADYSQIVTEEIEATSSDGTKVPLSVLRRRDARRDGARPTIVYGYAGYGISQTPNFSSSRLAWLERDGVMAVCHARGGGEKGHTWTVNGTHERKMNGVHDFEACAQALIDAGLTDRRHLFAQGNSMGGVLIGRTITDQPELFAAVDIGAGLLNPLRLHAMNNGITQLAEIGDPDNEADFPSVYAMDPYSHVIAAHYPATLFSIGLNDPRVAPWNSAKMAARLRAMTTSDRPVLIRVDEDAGHGIGGTTDQFLDHRVDQWSFFLAVSGDPAFQPR